MQNLSSEYWNERYKSANIGWDLGQVSPPIKEYVDQLNDKSIRILIPGCGNAYEAEYLHRQGFSNVNVLDFASEPLADLQRRVGDFPSEHLHQTDFFEHEGQYDLILEQTLFCAITPSLRPKYVEKVNRLLASNGKLVGLLFNREFDGGPPFGGNRNEYEQLFSKEFSKMEINECYNSIAPRQGSEVFIRIEKD